MQEHRAFISGCVLDLCRVHLDDLVLPLANESVHNKPITLQLARGVHEVMVLGLHANVRVGLVKNASVRSDGGCKTGVVIDACLTQRQKRITSPRASYETNWSESMFKGAPRSIGNAA